MDAATQRENPSNRIESLISALGSGDGAIRQQARLSLQNLGKTVIPALLDHVQDKNNQVRWEVAKTLEQLKDVTTSPAMVSLLADEVPGVRWLAAEGLIALGEKAIIPLLQGTQRHSHSAYFRESASHVLRALEHKGLLDDATADVLRTLEGIAPEETSPLAARRALDILIGWSADRGQAKAH